MPALSDKLNVCKTGYDALSFVQKNISKIDQEYNSTILGSTVNDSETVRKFIFIFRK